MAGGESERAVGDAVGDATAELTLYRAHRHACAHRMGMREKGVKEKNAFSLPISILF